MTIQIKEELVRETRDRVVAEGAWGEFAHVLLMAGVVYIAFPTVPHALLGVWGAAILALCGMRDHQRRRLRTRDQSGGEQHGTRATSTALAAAWGVGAGLFSRWLPFGDLALLLMIMTGLAAVATSTFAADRKTFRFLVAAMVVPLAAGLLTAGPLTHLHVVALLLIGLLSVAMIFTHQRGYASLQRQALTNVELSASEDRAARERARLDALFASAPIAIVVVDDDGRVRDANPQFRSLFGYTIDEVKGRALNSLIVPEAELERAIQLDETVRRGETVVVETERRRKDGRLVPVRSSASRVEGVGESGLFVLYEDISGEIAARATLEESKEAA